MRCLVTAGKHINDIRDIARQSPIATIEKLLKAVFSVGSAPRLYGGDTRRAELFQLRDIRRTVQPERVKLKNIHC
jgi:hypothetical protein